MDEELVVGRLVRIHDQYHEEAEFQGIYCNRYNPVKLAFIQDSEPHMVNHETVGLFLGQERMSYGHTPIDPADRLFHQLTTLYDVILVSDVVIQVQPGLFVDYYV